MTPIVIIVVLFGGIVAIVLFLLGGAFALARGEERLSRQNRGRKQ